MAKSVSTSILVRLVGRLVAAERRERGISRRSFLAGAVGSVGLAACGSSPQVPKAPSAGPVVVVGGGTAGLLCAYRLMQAEVPVTVLEASDRPGGRMLSDKKTFGPDLLCELGGEFVDSGHATIHALCKELGLTLDDVLTPSQGLSSLFHFGGKALTEKEVVEALKPAAAALTKDMDGLDLADLPHESGPGARALDALSIDGWLKARGITGLGGDILRLCFTTELGLEPDELGCITMLQMFSLEGEKLALYGESDERFHVRGGNDQIPRLLAEKLGDRIQYGARLGAVRRAADGRVVLAVAAGGSTRDQTADRAVLAIPFTMLRNVQIDPGLGFSPKKQQAIRELGYGNNSKLMLGFSKRLWEAEKRNGETFTDRPIQSTWDTSRTQASPEGILTMYSGGRLGAAQGEGSPEARRDAALIDLDALYPGAKAASNGKVARFHWPTSPLVMGSYASFKVGQLTAFGGAEGEVAGNVHFAGEHTSLEAQGFMEGAAESGQRAADEIIAAFRGEPAPKAASLGARRRVAGRLARAL